MKRKLLLFFLILSGVYSASAQKISIAPAMDVRYDDMFTLIGQVGNKILTFRNNNQKYILNIFDDKLNRNTSRNLIFEKKKIRIISITHEEKSWVLVYSYLDKKNEIINAYRYDNVGNRIDSARIYSEKKDPLLRKYKFTESEDEKQLLIFKKKGSKSMLFIRIDVNKLENNFTKTIKFEDINLNTDFRKVIITNTGTFYTIFEKNPTIFNKSKHKIIVNSFNSDKENYNTVSIDLEFKINKFLSKYDNLNEILTIAGIETKSYSNKSIGYFIFKINKNLNLSARINKPYNLGFIKDLYKLRDEKVKKYIKNIYIKDVLFRNDGGTILVFEIKEIFSRNRIMDTHRQRYYNNKDYLFKELGLISLHEDGDYFWHKIIPKYQFSTNDYGIYSSVFIFKTPYLLKLIFNDEIKNQNQIMMYSVNPLGKTHRKS